MVRELGPFIFFLGNLAKNIRKIFHSCTSYCIVYTGLLNIPNKGRQENLSQPIWTNNIYSLSVCVCVFCLFGWFVLLFSQRKRERRNKKKFSCKPDFDLLLVSQLQIFMAKSVVLTTCIHMLRSEENKIKLNTGLSVGMCSISKIWLFVSSVTSQYRTCPFQSLNLVSFQWKPGKTGRVQ